MKLWLKKCCRTTETKFKRKYWIYNPWCRGRNMAVLSKAWVYGRSLAGITGSNPARGDRHLSLVSVECCQVVVSTKGWVCECVCYWVWTGVPTKSRVKEIEIGKEQRRKEKSGKYRTCLHVTLAPRWIHIQSSSNLQKNTLLIHYKGQSVKQ